jgi:hypothetical protein
MGPRPRRHTYFRTLGLVTIWAIASSCLTLAQARSLISSPAQPVTLSSAPGQDIILGWVSLGRPQVFRVFNIQAAGTIAPDPDLNAAAFQLQFLICDLPDCSGDIRSDARILPDSDSAVPAQVLATRSFGVSTHNTAPVVLTDLRPRDPNGVLYLAVALKLLHGSTAAGAFTGKLNLLRVDVAP